MTRLRKKNLVKLVRLMNTQNERTFPPMKPLLESLDFVLSDAEIDVLLQLGTETYSREKAALKSGLHDNDFTSIFESLREKGFLKTLYTEGGERYTLHALLIGWFEGQFSALIGKPEEAEFSRRFMEYVTFGRKLNVFPLRTLMNLMRARSKVSNQSVGRVLTTGDSKGKKVVRIDRTIELPDSAVYPSKTVNDLILEYGKKGTIAQFTCMCRRMASNLDDPCRLKMPDDGGCLGFGDFVKPYVKYGQARPVSMERALEVIQMTREKGAVHSVFHERDDTRLPQVGICNCCPDCCGILGAYNMGSMPLRYSAFNLAGIPDQSKCNGCAKCVKYCPTSAISIVEKKAVITEKKCLGCGQCEFQCPQGAVSLHENQRTVFLPMLRKSNARYNHS